MKSYAKLHATMGLLGPTALHSYGFTRKNTFQTHLACECASHHTVNAALWHGADGIV